MLGRIREIRVRDLLLYYLFSLLIIVGLTFGLRYSIQLHLPQVYQWAIWIVYLVFTYFAGKYHTIGCVLMYKAFAPLKIRKRCRYEPTCSTYMIMAIKKYGLFIGVIKGIIRLTKCHPPNGGVDYP